MVVLAKEIKCIQRFSESISNRSKLTFFILPIFIFLFYVPLILLLSFIRLLDESMILTIFGFYYFFVFFPSFTLFGYNSQHIFLSKSLNRMSKINLKDMKERKKLKKEISIASHHFFLPFFGIERDYYNILIDTIKIRMKKIALFSEEKEFKKIKSTIKKLSINVKNREYDKICQNCLKIWHESEEPLKGYKIMSSFKRNLYSHRISIFMLILTVLIYLYMINI